MASAQASGDSWMQQWIDAQRAFIDRWKTTPQVEQASLLAKEWDSWWRTTTPETSEPASEALQKMRAARDTYLSGLAAAAQSANGQVSGSSPKPDASAAWQLLSTPFASYAQAWSGIPALGLARESVDIAREVAEAQAECERLATELGQVFVHVQTETLELLERKVSERNRDARPLSAYRELYDLWVECGEEIFSRVAASDAFTSLQARYGNAAMRLRRAQQRLAAQSLRALDLPTRAEMNSVHRRLRDLRDELERVRELQAGSARARPAAAKAKPRAKQTAKRTKRK